jgi:flagellar hook-basal body complex protein FliE
MSAILPIQGAESPLIDVVSVRRSDAPDGPGFAQLIGHGVMSLDAGIARAEGALAALSLGGNIATHDVMIAMEQARFAMQLAVELRNRVVEAYGELMRMPV